MGTITYNTVRNNPQYIYRATGGGVTFSANLSGVAAFDYFTDTAVANDAIYFSGPTGLEAFSNLYLNVGTAQAGTAIVLVWEYWSRTTATWVTCHDLTDNTVGFTVTGANTVVFPLQAGMYYSGVTVNGITNKAWIRCRIVSLTAITEGGANQTTAAKISDGMITLSSYTDGAPCTLTDIYNYCVASAPEVGAATWGNNSFSFPNCRFAVASRLRSTAENLFLGNGCYVAKLNFSYIHFGTKVGTDGWTESASSNIFFGYYTSSAWAYTSANAMMYGGRVQAYTSYVNSAARESAGNGLDITGIEAIGVTLIGSNLFSTGTMRRCVTGPPLVLSVAIGATLDRLALPSGGTYLVYAYGVAFTLTSLVFLTPTTAAHLIVNYGRDLTWLYVNPSPALPRVADTEQPVMRYLGSYAVVGKCFLYDASAGSYSDYTAQAQSVAVDDVPMGGDVGDCIYLKSAAQSGPALPPEFEWTITPQANTYTYAYEYWNGSAWAACADTWDLTYNFTTSGILFLQVGSTWASTTVNGTAGYWIRLRITAGSGSPTASRIRDRYGTGQANWSVQEQYDFNLTVVDSTGSPLSGATVTITDSDSTVVYSGNTNASGVIPQQELVCAHWWFDPLDPAAASPHYIVEQVFGDYVVAVSLAGYRSTSVQATITEPTSWTIALETNLGHAAVM